MFPDKLYKFKCDYLLEHGFTGHIKNVNYWYRKLFNIYRGKSATERYKESEAQKDLLAWVEQVEAKSVEAENVETDSIKAENPEDQ